MSIIRIAPDLLLDLNVKKSNKKSAILLPCFRKNNWKERSRGMTEMQQIKNKRVTIIKHLVGKVLVLVLVLV
jgi:hypothetical protein